MEIESRFGGGTVESNIVVRSESPCRRQNLRKTLIVENISFLLNWVPEIRLETHSGLKNWKVLTNTYTKIHLLDLWLMALKKSWRHHGFKPVKASEIGTANLLQCFLGLGLPKSTRIGRHENKNYDRTQFIHMDVFKTPSLRH